VSFDISRAPLGQRAASALVAELAKLDDTVERHYLEMKSDLDPSKNEFAKIAKYILGSANRMPELAAKAFEGYGVMVIGVVPGEVRGIPPVEMMEIDKIVKPKMAATEKGKVEDLLKRTEELTAQSHAIMKRLESLGGAQVKEIEGAAKGTQPGGPKAVGAGGNLVALGQEQYDLQECYNCHKVGGKGGLKKRGPHLDNVGNLMKPDELKEKILNPRAYMAEGFEKEYNKKLMPDKYKELMSDQEIDQLVAYLASLKDSAVETPKPIKK